MHSVCAKIVDFGFCVARRVSDHDASFIFVMSSTSFLLLDNTEFSQEKSAVRERQRGRWRRPRCGCRCIQRQYFPGVALFGSCTSVLQFQFVHWSLIMPSDCKETKV